MQRRDVFQKKVKKITFGESILLLHRIGKAEKERKTIKLRAYSSTNDPFLT